MTVVESMEVEGKERKPERKRTLKAGRSWRLTLRICQTGPCCAQTAGHCGCVCESVWGETDI